ncbi:MAG TPA: hypothetical protein VI320_12365, partial [Terracidiphilus sp.]|jgi:hypothetical protein
MDTLLNWQPETVPPHDFNRVEQGNRDAAQATGAIIADQVRHCSRLESWTSISSIGSWNIPHRM